LGQRKFSRTAPRCPQCDRLTVVCVCHEVPALTLRTRLCVVVHYRESLKTTNTGTVAARLVSGSSVVVHSHGFVPAPEPDFTGRRPLLLFPSEQATVLTPEHGQGTPVTLVVPDGSWSQARRMHRRVGWMSGLPHVTLPPSERRTAYLLRRSEREGGLATMEAIARALGILEGEPVERTLEEVFALLVKRTLAARGTPLVGG
jgi:DTW domain-containing protein YfiP